MADLQLRILGEDAASSAFSSAGAAARAAGQIIIDFAKESVKAFMESEKAQRQLELVAKSSAEAFKAQAASMAETNNISDELVMGLQTALLRYGEAPAAVEATTQAVLDYAAATGKDAQAATLALTKGVESGTGKFGELGVSIKATGDRTKDLAAATAALAAKYGGAAAADAQSLSGQARGTSEAFGELQESFGAVIASFSSKMNIIGSLTDAMRGLNYEIGGGKEADKAKEEKQTRFVEDMNRAADAVAATRRSLREAEAAGDKEGQDFARRQLDHALAEVRMLKASSGAVFKPDALPTVSDKPKMVGGGGTAKDAVDTFMLPSKASRLREGDYIDPADEAEKEFKAAILDSQKFIGDVGKREQSAREAEAKVAAAARAVALKEAQQTANELAAQQKKFADAGAAVGGAFANAAADAISQLSSGGEVDVGSIVAGLLPTILGVVGTAVGGPLGGAIGGALGGLAGAGIKAATKPSVTIQTFDSQSSREFFEGNGGRALYNAQRTGRGALGLGLY